MTTSRLLVHRGPVVRTLMPFSTDPWTMHSATSATLCSMRIAGMRTDRQGELDMGVDRFSLDATSGKTGGRRPGSFNAVINAPA
jgi:hypothetical protein